MAIFKYEMLQLKWYIFWWSAALAISIFGMLPTYMGFLTGAEIPAGMLAGNAFYDSIGLSMKYINTPIGVYGFLTSFMMIAAGINGMYLGLSIFTKECTGKTADFLMTKPYGRGKVFAAKTLAALTSAIIIGVAYMAGSFASVFSNGADNFDLKLVFLIGLSLIFLTLFFMAIGTFIGVLLPKIRTPLTFSAGVTFLFYITGTFSRKTGFIPGQFITPFVYFGHSNIIDTGGYDSTYMIVFLILVLLFTALSYNIFRKKDILLPS